MQARPGLALRVAWDLFRIPLIHRDARRIVRRGANGGGSGGGSGPAAAEAPSEAAE
jgi:hypothetical protein